MNRVLSGISLLMQVAVLFMGIATIAKGEHITNLTAMLAMVNGLILWLTVVVQDITITKTKKETSNED